MGLLFLFAKNQKTLPFNRQKSHFTIQLKKIIFRANPQQYPLVLYIEQIK